MSNLIQLAYVSRASFSETTTSGGVVNEVSKILQSSRRNNRKRNLVGALYYGNGAFFQCLEGERDAVMELYKKLEADSRHSDLRIVHEKAILRRTFDQWEMKYVPKDQDMQALISSFGMKEFNPFDPHTFNEVQSIQMVSMLASGANPEKPKNLVQANGTAKHEGSFSYSHIAYAALGMVGIGVVLLATRFA